MDKKRILAQVRRCLEHRTDGGGTYIDSENFAVTGSTKVDGGTEYTFETDAYTDSGFSGDDAGSGRVQGSIVLDDEYNPVLDKDGNVRLKPWTCRDPRRVEENLPEGPQDIPD